MSKLLRYQLWHLCLLCPPSPRKIRGENNHRFSTCEQDPCLLSICHDTQGKLSGRSCPARQVFSLWEQLNRADKTTIKKFHSWGSAADSSSWGTRTAPVRMLPGQLAACDTFSLPVPGTRGECQHILFQRHPTEALSSQQSRNQQKNKEIIPPIPLFQRSIQPLRLIFMYSSVLKQCWLIQGNVPIQVWLGLWL